MDGTEEFAHIAEAASLLLLTAHDVKDDGQAVGADLVMGDYRHFQEVARLLHEESLGYTWTNIQQRTDIYVTQKWHLMNYYYHYYFFFFCFSIVTI